MSSHPVYVPVNHPDEINEIFDRISYAKVTSLSALLYAESVCLKTVHVYYIYSSTVWHSIAFAQLFYILLAKVFFSQFKPSSVSFVVYFTLIYHVSFLDLCFQSVSFLRYSLILRIFVFQGASIIRMMRFFLGESVFKRGLTVRLTPI